MFSLEAIFDFFKRGIKKGMASRLKTQIFEKEA